MMASKEVITCFVFQTNKIEDLREIATLLQANGTNQSGGTFILDISQRLSVKLMNRKPSHFNYYEQQLRKKLANYHQMFIFKGSKNLDDRFKQNMGISIKLLLYVLSMRKWKKGGNYQVCELFATLDERDAVNLLRLRMKKEQQSKKNSEIFSRIVQNDQTENHFIYQDVNYLYSMNERHTPCKIVALMLKVLKDKLRGQRIECNINFDSFNNCHQFE